MAERRVDLQTHSTHSDGTCTPREIVELAAERDLAAVALTDHDTVAGLPELTEAGDALGVETIPGVELSCRVLGQDVDVLGYLIDPDDPELEATLEALRGYRRERMPKMLDALADEGIELSLADVKAQADSDVLGRPHLAQALVEAGHVDTVDAAFERYIGSEGPAYVPKQRLAPDEAIEAIHAAGGLAVMAHPCFVHPAYFPRVLETLVEAGLDGIEVYYSEHDHQHVAVFSRQAQRYGLVVTGGSDFHGQNKPGIELGEGRGDLDVPYRVVEQLRARKAERG